MIIGKEYKVLARVLNWVLDRASAYTGKNKSGSIDIPLTGP